MAAKNRSVSGGSGAAPVKSSSPASRPTARRSPASAAAWASHRRASAGVGGAAGHPGVVQPAAEVDGLLEPPPFVSGPGGDVGQGQVLQPLPDLGDGHVQRRLDLGQQGGGGAGVGVVGDAGAGDDRHVVGAEPVAHVGERQVGQGPPAVGQPAQRVQAPDLLEDVAVGELGALGLAGRARRVDDGDEVGRAAGAGTGAPGQSVSKEATSASPGRTASASESSSTTTSAGRGWPWRHLAEGLRRPVPPGPARSPRRRPGSRRTGRLSWPTGVLL